MRVALKIVDNKVNERIMNLFILFHQTFLIPTGPNGDIRCLDAVTQRH